jgi:hypothetical protein
MKKKFAIFALTLAFACVLTAQQQQREPALESAIVSKLSEIVKIRERLAESHKIMLANGRGVADGQVDIELAEARVALATELGDKAKTVAELKKLAAVHEMRAKSISEQVQRGVASTEQLGRAQAALLEAEVRLLRASR